MMDIRRNSEGYSDPTAFAALKSATKNDYPRTYIISPYAGRASALFDGSAAVDYNVPRPAPRAKTASNPTK